MTANWWGISASIVAWLGVAVIALALIGPWIRQCIKRRRRCPKCWYDMSHSPPPGMTCSECGYTAKRERKLYKARRRWKLAFLGLFMLIGAYALNLTPAVKSRGWVAAVPTAALLLGSDRLLYPDDEDDRLTWCASVHGRLWSEHDHLAEITTRIRDKRLSRRSAHRLARTSIEALADEERFREQSNGIRHRYKEGVDRPRILLDNLWSAGFLTPRLCGKIADLHRMPVEAPSHWPADEPLLIRAGWERGLTWRLRTDTRCRLSASWPSSREYVRTAPQFFRGAGFGTHPWTDGLLEIGVAPSSGDVDLELTFAVDMRSKPPRYERVTMPPGFFATRVHHAPWDEVRRVQTRHRIQVTGTANDHRAGVPLPELSVALQRSLSPTIRQTCGHDITSIWPSPFMDDMWADSAEVTNRVSQQNECIYTVEVPLDSLARYSVWRETAGVTIAVRLEALQDGVPFGAGFAWWRYEDESRYPRGTAVKITALDPNIEFNPNASWELRLTGDAAVALRNFDSTMYWDGTLKVPMRVWQPPPAPQVPLQ